MRQHRSQACHLHSSGKMGAVMQATFDSMVHPSMVHPVSMVASAMCSHWMDAHWLCVCASSHPNGCGHSTTMQLEYLTVGDVGL
jgi:hypothetical protein